MPSIEHLSESGVLARILPHAAQGSTVEVGPGDDSAVVRLASPRLVVSTDAMTEGEDFLRGAITGEQLGAKAAVQNMADVAAMGARPEALVMALSAPASTEAAFLEDLMRGFSERAEREGASVVGGDLGRTDRIFVAVTAMGSLAEGQAPILRSGARPGDELAVASPRLGRSAAGLALVLAGRAHDKDPAIAPLIAFHHSPLADLAAGWTAARAGDGATAMIDVSDGLVADASRIAAASGVTIDLDRTALAPDAEALGDAARELGEDPWLWVLHSGEEHALLATFPPGQVAAPFRAIGRVEAADGAGARVLLDGGPVPGSAFDHFR